MKSLFEDYDEDTIGIGDYVKFWIEERRLGETIKDYRFGKVESFKHGAVVILAGYSYWDWDNNNRVRKLDGFSSAVKSIRKLEDITKLGIEELI